jgi:curved DNA-binding protein CbpA
VSGSTYYEVLGVGRDADTEEVRAAYRRLLRRVHSDVGGTDALFQYVRRAYEVLSDSSSRREYDRSLDEGQRRDEGSDPGAGADSASGSSSGSSTGRAGREDHTNKSAPPDPSTRVSAERAVDRRRRRVLGAVAVVLVLALVFYFYRLSTEVKFEIRGSATAGPQQVSVHYWSDSTGPAGVTTTGTLPFDISFHPSKHETMRVTAYGSVSSCYVTDGFGTQLDSAGGEGEVDCQYIYEANKN